jgi:glycosyltransferase involved in cell wall biosynthesis
MRVALVVTGGVDESARHRITPILVWLVERLARRHDVHVYVLRYHEQPRTYPFLGATVHDLGRPDGLRGQHRALMQALRRDGPFDVLHAHWALPSGVVAAVAGRRLRTPTIVTLDSGEFVALPEIAYGNQLRVRQRAAVAATLRLATRLTVCTRFQEQLARAHGASPDVIPWGIDATRLHPGYRPDGPPWRLLHVANLNPVKDQRLLLDAFQKLRARQLPVTLDIVGTDTLHGAIERYATEIGVSDAVTFHGFQTSEELAGFYQRSHLLVVTSLHEAAGVVILEAAACDTPTIGTPVGYIADWSPDAAIAVPSRGAEQLADGIDALLRLPNERARIASNARVWTLAHDADWTAAQFDRLYEAVAARRR